MYNEIELGIDESSLLFIGIWTRRPVGFIWEVV